MGGEAAHIGVSLEGLLAAEGLVGAGFVAPPTVSAAAVLTAAEGPSSVTPACMFKTGDFEEGPGGEVEEEEEEEDKGGFANEKHESSDDDDLAVAVAVGYGRQSGPAPPPLKTGGSQIGVQPLLLVPRGSESQQAGGEGGPHANSSVRTGLPVQELIACSIAAEIEEMVGSPPPASLSSHGCPSSWLSAAQEDRPPATASRAVSSDAALLMHPSTDASVWDALGPKRCLSASLRHSATAPAAAPTCLSGSQCAVSAFPPLDIIESINDWSGVAAAAASGTAAAVDAGDSGNDDKPLHGIGSTLKKIFSFKSQGSAGHDGSAPTRSATSFCVGPLTGATTGVSARSMAAASFTVGGAHHHHLAHHSMQISLEQLTSTHRQALRRRSACPMQPMGREEGGASFHTSRRSCDIRSHSAAQQHGVHRGRASCDLMQPHLGHYQHGVHRGRTSSDLQPHHHGHHHGPAALIRPLSLHDQDERTALSFFAHAHGSASQH